MANIEAKTLFCEIENRKIAQKVKKITKGVIEKKLWNQNDFGVSLSWWGRCTAIFPFNLVELKKEFPEVDFYLINQYENDFVSVTKYEGDHKARILTFIENAEFFKKVPKEKSELTNLDLKKLLEIDSMFFSPSVPIDVDSEEYDKCYFKHRFIQEEGFLELEKVERLKLLSGVLFSKCPFQNAYVRNKFAANEQEVLLDMTLDELDQKENCQSISDKRKTVYKMLMEKADDLEFTGEV
ncbi:hypothetical protein LNTAR_25435 [Lentisphaera araneosa HTCC2155]|uniref:Uncharacterized protein n=1 Tax=Lentisphaera araneosa HTCC2155 TaxID=313628 RepID=A6DSC9_9BACT|nr:hypothetical protein [Lentisphaera araneosa]EDM25474.1 hypothetical protein LNTAR_25435 [Lentisphaera araneosa HTCC2155]